MKYFIVILIWSGFGAIHSLLIDLRVTHWASRVMGRYFAYYRLIYNLLSTLLFFVLFQYSKSLDTELVITFIPPWTYLQGFLLLASALMIVWAFLSYDPLEFIGIRQLRGAGTQKQNTAPQSITDTGLLGIVRHPMYLATLIFMWSLNSTRVDILVHLMLTLYVLVGIKFEERKLVKQFGDEYIEYQRRVPALIPFPKRWLRALQ